MADATAILEPLRRDPNHAAVICDIDGTLAPIVEDPGAAAVPAETRAVLGELANRYLLVACVSGRRASAARRIVGLDRLTYVGNHGLELLAPGEADPRLDPALAGRETAAADFVSRLDWDDLGRIGMRLEDKGPIQAIHWRGAEDAAVAERRAERVAELVAEQGLVPHRGRMVLEVRPLAEVDKGVAVRRLLSDSGARAALFGGDDRTDLDAFDALRQLTAEGALSDAVCVGVASAEGPEQLQRLADLMVEGPAGFVELLRDL